MWLTLLKQSRSTTVRLYSAIKFETKEISFQRLSIYGLWYHRMMLARRQQRAVIIILPNKTKFVRSLLKYALSKQDSTEAIIFPCSRLIIII
jgi:hypothetical protein